jgi:DsbC/DsbD-like thiol-disulfide interchange protein
MIVRHKRFPSALAVCGIILVLATSARADSVSPWVDDIRSSLRLIAGNEKPGAENLRAGVEVKLQPGWHTYWRYPGDSGVPPRFNFAGSDNVATVKVLYPAPQSITDEAGVTIGYNHNVIFPLRVVPRQQGKPVTLRLQADYAVCEKLCVPVEARAQLTLSGPASASDASLAAAEARVPKDVSKADAGLSARRVYGDKHKPLVFVDLIAPTGEKIEIFAEGPTAEWALPIPRPTPGAPAGHQHFAFALDGLPPGVDPKGPFELTFTIVPTDRPPIEVKTRLD